MNGNRPRARVVVVTCKSCGRRVEVTPVRGQKVEFTMPHAEGCAYAKVMATPDEKAWIATYGQPLEFTPKG